MSLSIIPLRIGRNIGSEKGVMISNVYDRGVKIDNAHIMWYIKGTREKIVVDSGPSDPEQANKYHPFLVLERTEEERPANALRKIGVKPEEVEIVIYTHLHWDHIYNNEIFTKARFIVQRKELQYAIAPLPVHGLVYESQIIGMRPNFLKILDRMELVDEDREITKGVSVALTPGHTPGIQGINVETEKGNYFIASDNVLLFENWRGKPPYHRHIPVGTYFVDLEEYYRTFQKIEKIADFVLPGHDMKVFEKRSYP